MKVRITDKATFDALKPSNLVAYLRTEGWKLTGNLGERASVWTRGETEVLVPLDTTPADYALRVAEVLDAISECEERSQLEVLRDLSTASSDVIRIRIASAASEDGTLNLEDGVTLITGTRDMIFAAARAAVSPRAYFRSRLPSAADDYLRKVRLGQTERGSFVATVICPVPPELHAAAHSESGFLQNIEEPFERMVTQTLSTGLLYTSSALQESLLEQNVLPFTKGVYSGVSANLCDALAEIGETMEYGRVEVNFSWARTRAKPKEAASRIVIQSDAMPLLREAARVLKETYWDDDFELVGPVGRLERGSSGGVVYVYAPVGDGYRRVRVILNRADYNKAAHAHAEGWEIRCRGRLSKEGRYYTLRDVRGFEPDKTPF